MRLISILLAFCLLFGCMGLTTVKEIKDNPEAYLGEQVSVKGTVKDTFKLGKLSGFKLQDGNHSIMVSSEELPNEGKEVVVKGTVMKEILVGYYILAKEIN